MPKKTDIGKSLSSGHLKPLSAQERLFLDAYTGPANYNKMKALDAAYPANINHKKVHKEAEANAILARPHVAHQLKLHQDSVSKKFHMSEEDILNRLWTEATREDDKAQHSARISALVWLGKHLGMFQEKKQEVSGPSSVTYNVVNYSSAASIREEKEVSSVREEATPNLLPTGLTIKNFGDN